MVLFHEPVAGFYSVFGIVPPYDFDHGKLIRPKYYKIRVAILAIVFAVVTVAMIFLRDSYIGIFEKKVIEIPLVVTGNAVIVVAMLCSCVHQSRWAQFFAKMAAVENLLGSKATLPRGVARDPRVQLSVLGAAHCVCVVRHFYLPDVIGDRPRLILVALYAHQEVVVLYYYEIICFAVANFCVAFSHKYKRLNGVLRNATAQNKWRVSGRVKRVERIYCELFEAVAIFNDVLGPVLFLIPIKGFFGLMAYVFYLRHLFLGTFEVNSTEQKITGLCITFAMLAAPAIVMIFCDVVSREANNLVVTCHRLQNEFPISSQTYWELHLLAHKFSSLKIKFTGVDVFELNRGQIFSLLGTTATYFIATDQFFDFNSKRGLTHAYWANKTLA